MSRQGEPEGALDPEAPDAAASPTPDQGAAEPVEPTPANKPPEPDDPILLRRAFTQSQQKWSTLRKELGLSKDATPDDVMAAIAAARKPAEPEADDEGDDARLPTVAALEAEARAEAAEWRLQAAYYPGTAEAAREFADIARTERDPEALTLKFYELLNRFTAQPTGEPPAATGDEPATGDSADDVIDVGIGDSPAADDVSATNAAALERLKGSGRVAEGMRHIPGWDRLVGRPG